MRRKASFVTMRLTPSDRAIASNDGSLSPGAQRPDSMAERRPSSTCLTSGRTSFFSIANGSCVVMAPDYTNYTQLVNLISIPGARPKSVRATERKERKENSG